MRLLFVPTRNRGKGKLVGQKAVLPIGGRPGYSLPRPSRNLDRRPAPHSSQLVSLRHRQDEVERFEPGAVAPDDGPNDPGQAPLLCKSSISCVVARRARKLRSSRDLNHWRSALKASTRSAIARAESSFAFAAVANDPAVNFRFMLREQSHVCVPR
jgi:hypothetical protein